MQEEDKALLSDEDKELSSEQTYDSALATMISKLVRFIIPLINEVFDEKFTKGATVEIKSSKHILAQIDGRLSRRETDAYVKLSEVIGQLVEKFYHIECETWYGKDIIVRIAEYSSVIALDNAQITADGVKLVYPYSVVIFLRPNNSIPKKLKITHCAPNGQEMYYDVPTIQIRDYTLDDIFKKDLLLLLPFYLFRFANEFEKMEEDENRRKKIDDALQEIEDRLNELLQEKTISVYQKLTIEDLLLRVSDKLTIKHKKVREGVNKIMSGYILKTRADELLEQGEEKGLKELSSLMNYLLSNGKEEDARRASTDMTFLKGLLAEYNNGMLTTN